MQIYRCWVVSGKSRLSIAIPIPLWLLTIAISIYALVFQIRAPVKADGDWNGSVIQLLAALAGATVAINIYVIGK